MELNKHDDGLEWTFTMITVLKFRLILIPPQILTPAPFVKL